MLFNKKNFSPKKIFTQINVKKLKKNIYLNKVEKKKSKKNLI